MPSVDSWQNINLLCLSGVILMIIHTQLYPQKNRGCIYNHLEHTHQCSRVIGWLRWDRASGGAQVMRRKEVDESPPPQEITSFLSALYSFCVSGCPPHHHHTAPDVINESLRLHTYSQLFQTTAAKQPFLTRGANTASRTERHSFFFMSYAVCGWTRLRGYRHSVLVKVRLGP